MRQGLVIVLGASSQIGLYAVPLLRASGFPVLAVSRGGPPAGFPPMDGVLWRRPGEVLTDRARPGRRRADAPPRFLLSAGPLALALHGLEAWPEIERVVAFSTTSVLSKAGSGSARERSEIDAILAAESGLQRFCERRGSGLCLLRPTLVYGCGMDRNVSFIARWIRRWGFFPLARKANGLRCPVHAHDLAGAAVTALSTPAGDGLVSPLCGGERLGYRDLVTRIFLALDKPPRIPEWPAPLLTIPLGMAGLFGAGASVNAQMIHRQYEDLVFDDGPARQRLHWRPRGFQPRASDFEAPEAADLLRLAGQAGED